MNLSFSNAPSPIHATMQLHLALAVYRKKGNWNIQVDTEYPLVDRKVLIRPDVLVQYMKAGKRYTIIYEIQKDLTHPKFIEKIEKINLYRLNKIPFRSRYGKEIYIDELIVIDESEISWNVPGIIEEADHLIITPSSE